MNNDNSKDNKVPAGPMGRGRGFGGQKPKSFIGALSKLALYIKKMLPLVIVSLVLSAGSAVVSIITPRKLGEMVALLEKSIRSGGAVDMAGISQIAYVLLALVLVGSFCYFSQGQIMTTVTQRTGKRLRSDIDKKINRLPLSYFDSKSFGDVLSRVTNDVDTITQSITQSVTGLLYTAVLLVGLIIMMFVTNWVLALVALATVPISMLIMMGIVKFSQKHFLAHQSQLGQLNGHIEEIYSGHEVVRAYSGESAAKARFDKINSDMARSAWKSNFLSGLMFPIINFVANLGLVAVCVTGGVLIVKNSGAGAGDVVAFIFYIRLFTNPITQLAQTVSGLQSAAAASERVFEFLGEKEMADEKHKKPAIFAGFLENFKGKVEFRNVSFGYSPDIKVINNFSAIAHEGQKIAIVGPTGAGKTTVVGLLMRFYEIDSGEILIDGVPISSMTREEVRSLFGMVLQDTWLFEGTLRENIAYAKQDASDEQVFAAAESAGIDHIIRALPGGYNMVLDDTANLSVGERQLVTIARAIVQNAPMLILDEATSAVDTRTEVLIQQAMDKLTKGRTSFIIAHRLSTIKNADLILVMKGGDIIEQGKHEELLKNNGFYSQLYKSQFESV